MSAWKLAIQIAGVLALALAAAFSPTGFSFILMPANSFAIRGSITTIAARVDVGERVLEQYLGFHEGSPWSEVGARQPLVTMTSRYSLGITSELAPAVLSLSSRASRSRLERLLAGGRERREGLLRRPVVVAEHLHEVRRRAVAEVEVAAFAAHRRGARAEQRGAVRLGAPRRRRLQPGGRRQVPADQLEQLADEALRRPVGHAEAAARTQHAQHLVGGALVVGREHRAEGREHDVEAPVGERQVLDVGDLERHRQSFGLGPRRALVEQGGHVVGRGDVGEAPRRRERGVAVAGGDVEDALAAAHVDGLGQRLADDLQGGADDGVVAAGPGGLLPLLDGGEVGSRKHGGGGCGLHVHGHGSWWSEVRGLSIRRRRRTAPAPAGSAASAPG